MWRDGSVSAQDWKNADRKHCWHPFTRQEEWEQNNPLVLVSGEGVWLTDAEGNRYLDANSSIWTNVHGHKHPVITEAIKRQLDDVAHTSYLGFANPRASELAERLCAFFPENTLERVFFSDDGSTAIECAVKMALQYRQLTGEPERTQFIAFDQAYHGDTMGAASLGGVSAFADRFKAWGYDVHHVPSIELLESLTPEIVDQTAAVLIEPLVQGVNQIHLWPKGMLASLREWCDTHGVHLILDEVMTGFGRSGSMFACQQEEVIPDFLCLAKGLTGGYLPLAATLTKEKIYKAFLGGAERAFYYGHSYTANQLGCAAALANLDVFEQENTIAGLPEKINHLNDGLKKLRKGGILTYELRQCGMVAGIELRQSDGQAFAPSKRVGEAFCLEARKHGILTRPILDTIVVMPPLSITNEEISFLIDGLSKTMSEAAIWLAK